MSYSIEINNISKVYHPKKEKSERLKEWFLPFYKSKGTQFHALEDIRFNVGVGESVGIVGLNGAGKSTLLKVITGTTSPTVGTVVIRGRVVALLELGMGFHPDFTGRENIILAGQLIGLSTDEVCARSAQIEEFAEIGRFIDEPVRTYSSGMQMRLAFALATAVRPDVLIVDEALSVGDSYFQQKSFAKIRSFKSEGTTLLFVSHDKSAVLTLCDRAVLLNKGRMILDDKPSIVMDYYNSLIAEKYEGEFEIEQSVSNNVVRTISGNKTVFFVDVTLQNMSGDKIEYAKVGEHLRLVANIMSTIDSDNVVFGFLIKERTGMEVFGSNTFLMGEVVKVKKNIAKEISVEFDANIGKGIYSISVALHTEHTHLINNYHWVDLAVTFSMINIDKNEFVGVAHLEPTFKV